MSTDVTASEESTGPTRRSTKGAKERKRSGFGAMDPARVREIARRGGKAAHAAGTAHEFTSEEARAAGRKGGYAASRSRRGAAARQRMRATST
jgi:general stress protein YciG